MNVEQIIAVLCVFLGLNITVVRSQCVNLLYQYYVCKNPSAILDDAFFESKLNGLTTYDSVMDFFKSIYVELNWNECTSPLCTCVRQNPDLITRNYGAFFVNPNYFADMKSIVSSVRNKYTRLTPSQVNVNLSTLASVNSFCINYEFSFALLLFYNETSACYSNAKLTVQVIQCAPKLSNVDILQPNLNISNQPVSNLEAFAKCLAAQTSSCDIEIRRDIVYNFLSYYPNIIRGGLLDYVNYLINASSANGLFSIPLTFAITLFVCLFVNSQYA